MSQSFKPDHYPQLMPYLTVVDAQKSLVFYEKAFQFVLHEPPMEENNKILHAALRHGHCVVMMSPEGAFGSELSAPITSKITLPFGLYVYVEDIDSFFETAKSNGAKVKAKPELMFWGDKTCCLIDINGYEWTFATHYAKSDSC